MVADVPRDQILIQVYAGGCGRDSLQSLQAVLVNAFPGVAILGATTEGEILGKTTSQNTIVLSLSVFEDTKVKTLYADDSKPEATQPICQGDQRSGGNCCHSVSLWCYGWPFAAQP